MDPIEAGSQSTSGVTVVTRKYMFDRVQRYDLPNLEEKLDAFRSHLLSSDDYTQEQIVTLKRNFAHFKSQIKQRWLKAYKKEDIFLKTNHSWLEGTFEIPTISQNRPGRPCKLFKQSSDLSLDCLLLVLTKRRKTEEIRSVVAQDVIIHAAQVELRKSGKRDASEILKEITSTPTRASKYKKAFSKSTREKTSLTPIQALLMFVEADLTRRQYEIVRNSNKKFFPCYTQLQKAKQE
ncbi:unnamed protein product [Colias eurytheme]|nr:unnamed protein product [Colias eurytheme]